MQIVENAGPSYDIIQQHTLMYYGMCVCLYNISQLCYNVIIRSCINTRK